LFWYVAVMNAINLVDGLDGLATGLSAISAMVMFLIGLTTGNVVLALLSATLLGALLGFLLFNSNPARIFMGDSGSLLIGFLLASFAIMSSNKSSTAVALLAPLLSLGVPFLDMGLSVVRRFFFRQPVMEGDRRHLHHLLMDRGLTHRNAVLALYGLGLSFAAAAVVFLYATRWTTFLLLAGVLGIVVLTARLLGYQNVLWFTRGSASLMETASVRRFRVLLAELATDPKAALTWPAFAGLLERHGIRSVSLGLDGEAVPRFHYAFDLAEDPQIRRIVLGTRKDIALPDGTPAEFRLEWLADPGMLAPLPHEEVLIQVLADIAARLPLPTQAAVAASSSGGGMP
jgi:hypothetical protein